MAKKVVCAERDSSIEKEMMIPEEKKKALYENERYIHIAMNPETNAMYYSEGENTTEEDFIQSSFMYFNFVLQFVNRIDPEAKELILDTMSTMVELEKMAMQITSTTIS